MSDISQQKQSKTLDFALLRKKPTYLRFDVLSAPIICFLYHYVFGEVAFDWEHLLATVVLILTITLIFLIFLLNFWSPSAHVFYAYSSLNGNKIDQCTHVRIRLENKKQHTVKKYVVPIIVNMIATASGQINKAYQIEFNKKRLLYNAEKKTFSPIPFPIHQSIEFYQNSQGILND